ncbi:hypothetical protein PHET_06182 [Paragonimus heterotremus]|uniref:Uncharacterized protein n=1 Tax=Paragonimus heterotremus TaxID=100268 RepID=A0A8J4SX50_9TREM|nr:hypothetical protein PHET_06182 [Paragonimus heterotremus]
MLTSPKAAAKAAMTTRLKKRRPASEKRSRELILHSDGLSHKQLHTREKQIKMKSAWKGAKDRLNTTNSGSKTL